MCRSNILFLFCGDKGSNHKLHESQHEWLEFMCSEYSDKTVVIVDHNAIHGTTDYSNDRKYRWRHDEEFWWDLFHDNNNIRAFIHGHNHVMDWDVLSNNNQEGYGGTNGSWDHNIAFIAPPAQRNPYATHDPDEFTVINISSSSISTDTYRHDGGTEGWQSDYDHTYSIGTSYDESVDDWYSIPFFLQDGETQIVSNDVIPSQNVTLQLVGVRPYSLFNDPNLVDWNDDSVNKVYSGCFDDDTSGVSNIDLVDGGIQVSGSKVLPFPCTTSYDAGASDGRSGQIKDFIQCGSTSVGIPGETYNVSITARVTIGSGDITLDMSVQDVSSNSQYDYLSGSESQVFTHSFDTNFETVYGSYTVPDDNNAGFLQGNLSFDDSKTYQVTEFTITRDRSSDSTSDFHLKLNDVWYNDSGTLSENSYDEFYVSPLNTINDTGYISLYADIGGNHQGMALLYYSEPFLLTRNARFVVNSYDDDVVNLTLKSRSSEWTGSVFKVLPFNTNYETFTMTNGDVYTEPNGNKWGETSYSEDKYIEINFTGLGGESVSFLSINGEVNSSTIRDKTPVINWTVISQASKYHLQIDNNSDFSSPEIDYSNISELNYPSNFEIVDNTASFILPVELSSYTKYYMKVRTYVTN